MSTATSGRAREHKVRDHMTLDGWQLPLPRGRAPECACGCGNRVSTVRTAYIMGHRPSRNNSETFWDRVDKSAGETACWLWTGYIYKNGYATATIAGRRRMAHRYAYEFGTGETVPDDLTIDHLCKTRHCMNPAHMEVVTRGENARRGEMSKAVKERRRIKADVGCPSGHPRTPEHARKDKDGFWRCKTCYREKRAAGVWK